MSALRCRRSITNHTPGSKVSVLVGIVVDVIIGTGTVCVALGFLCQAKHIAWELLTLDEGSGWRRPWVILSRRVLDLMLLVLYTPNRASLKLVFSNRIPLTCPGAMGAGRPPPAGMVGGVMGGVGRGVAPPPTPLAPAAGGGGKLGSG